MKNIFILIGLFCIVVADSWGETVSASETEVSQARLFKEKFSKDYLFVLNPFVGTSYSDINVSNLNAPTDGSVKDISGEWGVFGLLTTPHFDFSNFFFSSEINGSYDLDLPKLTGNPQAPKIPIPESFDVRGNVSYVNAYLDKNALVTPNIGAGYFYHRVRGDYTNVTVKEPMLKLGLRFNFKEINLILNPYLMYAWERTDVEINGYGKSLNVKTSNDSLIYGFSAKYRWRLIHSELRYSYQDSLVGKKGVNSLGTQVSVFLNSWAGLSAYFHYRDGIVCREKSFLFGPAFVF
jgi:hypothetical protein